MVVPSVAALVDLCSEDRVGSVKGQLVLTGFDDARTALNSRSERHNLRDTSLLNELLHDVQGLLCVLADSASGLRGLLALVARKAGRAVLRGSVQEWESVPT